MGQHTKKQHYVPRFLLQHFCEQRDRLYVFDKETGRSWPSCPLDTFCKSGFNEQTTRKGEWISNERDYMHVESYAAPIVKRVLDGAGVLALSPRDGQWLRVFVLVQMLRGPGLRAMIADKDRRMRSFFPDGKMSEQAAKQIGTLTEQESVQASLVFPFAMLPDFLPVFSRLFSYVATAYPGTTFLMGDSPVVRHNSTPSRHYGNLGIGCRGIEVYMPLSKDVMLCFLDPELAGRLAVIQRDIRSAMERGTRVRFTGENVTYIKSLQVMYAERFLVASDGDFALPMKMLADNPRFRKGQRFEIVQGHKELEEVTDWNPVVVSRPPGNEAGRWPQHSWP